MRLNTGSTRAYTYRVTVQPTVLPVTLAVAKDYLKVKVSSEDALIDTLIGVATTFAEKFTSRDFITRTYETFRDFFPVACSSEGYYACGFLPRFNVSSFSSVGGNIGFNLRRSPLQSITSIQYLVDNVLTLVPSTVFYNTIENDYSEVLTLQDQLWPDDNDQRLQSIVITFVVGFGDGPLNMPKWVTTGILQHVAMMYENRGDCFDSSGSCDCLKFLPTTSEALYLQNRIKNL